MCWMKTTNKDKLSSMNVISRNQDNTELLTNSQKEFEKVPYVAMSDENNKTTVAT